MSSTIVIFDFSEKSNLQNWKVVDDAVMGGVSSGNFSVNKNGNGVFSGDVSLDNNGGFSSLRYDTNRITFDNQTTFKIRLKGDGKKYQFRVKSNSRDRHSYSFIFSTNGNWQEIEIPFSKMKPVFRGRNLDMDNFAGNQLEEISFLIGNGKAEKFEILIDFIHAI